MMVPFRRRRPAASVRPLACCALFAAALAVPFDARAQLVLPDSEPQTTSAGQPSTGSEGQGSWRVIVGAGAAVGPAYEGASKFRTSPLPIIDATYANRFFISTTNGIGVNIVATPLYRLGASVTYAPGRDQDLDGHLRGLGDISPGAQFKLFGSYVLGDVVLAAAIRHDLGATDGTLFDAGISYRWRPSERLALTFGPYMTLMDDKYAEKYFGVTPGQSRSAIQLGNPLAPFSPQGGVRDLSFAVNAAYRFNAHWGLGARLGFAYLVGDAADSPITRRDIEPVGGVFVTYRF
jgi:outer membrane protein